MLTILERNPPDPRQVVQLYRASLDMARTYNHCGLLDDFYEHVTKISTSDQTCRYIYISIDVRVHMLMPGWYPCIPGWHCDDFLRKPDGDPDLDGIAMDPAGKGSIHIATTIDFGTWSLPQFLNSKDSNIAALVIGMDTTFTRRRSQSLYSFYDNEINSRVQKCDIDTPQSGEVYSFGPLDFHRGMPATGRGWRVFARATFSNHRKPKDEIRTQSQVYLTDVGAGW